MLLNSKHKRRDAKPRIFLAPNVLKLCQSFTLNGTDYECWPVARLAAPAYP